MNTAAYNNRLNLRVKIIEILNTGIFSGNVFYRKVQEISTQKIVHVPLKT